jgi:zinc protease
VRPRPWPRCPAALAAALLALPLFTPPARAAEAALASGAPLLVEVDGGLPRQTVRLTFAGGPALVPPALQGLLRILSEVLGEGTQSLREDAFRRKLFLLNARIEARASARAISLIITAPPDRLFETLELAQRVLAQPALDRKTFDTARAKVLAEAQVLVDDMQELLFYVGLRDAFGYHPDLLDGAASPRAVEGVTLEKVRELLPALLDFRNLSVASAGPVPLDRLKQALERTFFAPELRRPMFTGYTFPALDLVRFRREALQVTLIDKPGAADNQILFVYPEAWQQDGPEQALAEVAHLILGEGVSSRLNDTLRTRRGLTYHAGTFLVTGVPMWMAWTFGGAKEAPALLQGVPEVIAAFRKERLRRADVEQAAARRIARWKEELELPADRLARQVKLRLFGLDPGHLTRHEAALAAVTAPAVQAFVRQRIDLRGGYLYVMGDRARLAPLLEKLTSPGAPLRVLQVRDVL